MERLEYHHICIAAIADVPIAGENAFSDEEIAIFLKACAPRENKEITFTMANNPIWVTYHKRWLATLSRVRDDAYAAGKRAVRVKTRTRTQRKTVTKKTMKKK